MLFFWPFRALHSQSQTHIQLRILKILEICTYSSCQTLTESVPPPPPCTQAPGSETQTGQKNSLYPQPLFQLRVVGNERKSTLLSRRGETKSVETFLIFEFLLALLSPGMELLFRVSYELHMWKICFTYFFCYYSNIHFFVCDSPSSSCFLNGLS